MASFPKLLRDRHVLITGGSSGIGLALARQALHSGARVSLVARDAARLAAAGQGLAAGADPAATVFSAAADVSDASALKAALAAAEAALGPVDVLVTAAGVARAGYFEEIPVADFERAMAVNYFGTLYAVQAVLPAMRARGRGTVVLISSGTALFGVFGYTAYGPTKFAVRGLAESLRAELDGSGVQISIVYPPDTDTPQLREENRTKPVETQAISASAGVWTAEAVAAFTWRRVAAGRFRIVPGFVLTALAWWHSLVDPVLHRCFARTARRARRRADRP